MHPDHKQYLHYTPRQRVDKAINTLTGLFQGISIDGHLNESECRELASWCNEQQDIISQHPFSELVPKVRSALVDGEIDSEEQADILWMCQNISPGNDYYDYITSELQILHGILHGILADGEISVEEATALSDWIDDHSHLKGTYPFDELESLLTVVLKDGSVDEQEHQLLKEFFEEFISYSLSRRIKEAREDSEIGRKIRLPGICAVCPDLDFAEKVFCLTGASIRKTRADIEGMITDLGGKLSKNVSKKIHYLIIGGAGNPCWAFSCYGRKVEQAVALRRDGHQLIIVHENDFWDAVSDVE